MSRAPWIIAHDGTGRSGKPPYTIECTRCRVSLVVETPIAVTGWVRLADGFARQHRRCRMRRTA